MKNVISCITMIATFSQNGHDEEALNIFKQLQLSSVKPNLKTFDVVLLACTNMKTLEQGIEVHEDIMRNGFHFDAFGETILVDVISKCGSMENAYGVFDKMPH